jgi:hypothetical protein
MQQFGFAQHSTAHHGRRTLFLQHSGHDFKGCAKTRALYQGTTSVVP